IGTGAVGGRMPVYLEIGRQGGRMILERLGRTAPEALRPPEKSAVEAQLDWNQVRRWKIDPALVPANAILHFKQPTFWEAYRTHVIVIVAVVLLQALLIAGLL